MTGNGCCDQRGIGNGCCALLRVHHRFRGQCRHLVHCRGQNLCRRSLEVVASVVLYTCLLICLITTQLDNALRSVGTLHARQQGQKYLNGVQKSCSQSTTSNFDRGLVRVHPEERVIRDGLGRHTMHATKVVFIIIEHLLLFNQVVKKGSFGDLLMGRDLKALRIDIPLLLARSRGRRFHFPVPHRAQGQY